MLVILADARPISNGHAMPFHGSIISPSAIPPLREALRCGFSWPCLWHTLFPSLLSCADSRRSERLVSQEQNGEAESIRIVLRQGKIGIGLAQTGGLRRDT